MFFAILLFEVMDKMPTVEYMYATGIVLSLIVFAATYFHRQVGLITLILVGILSVREIESDIIDGVINEAGQGYVNHWYFSHRVSLILSVILFFAAIIFKRRLKQNKNLD